ncbi:MAG: ROK family protein [Candidatus Eremiobacteraeota bacterium]|nr:ROK family protein [Candidatus Eremiobacteraeota bacterium]
MRFGIDLGGTKIEIAVIDEGGSIVVRRRVPTPQGRYRATLEAIASLVSDVETEFGRAANVGIGIPGAISPSSQCVKNANSTVLNGKPLHLDLETTLGRTLRFANDANCLALSEANGGAGAGATLLFAAILGTGAGGGVAAGGTPWEGRNAIAGEWGHNPLPWPHDGERPGPACYCGKHGCLETFLSGPSLARAYRDAGGAAVDTQELVARADAGETLAESVLRTYEDRLARGLATVANLLDPDVIVLGGGLSNVTRLYANVAAAMRSYVFSDRFDTPIVPARFGDSSGVRGAAMLWPP